MMTDPRAACANAKERAGWAILHDLVAHPLMALTRWSARSVRFHDWTSARAWPRDMPRVVDKDRGYTYVESSVWGLLQVEHLVGDFYEIRHPNVDLHVIHCQAADAIAAAAVATSWFTDLAEQHGVAPWLPVKRDDAVA